MIIRKICNGFISKAFFQRPIPYTCIVINSSKFNENWTNEKKWKSTDNSVVEEDLDKPVKFSTSKAAAFKSEQLFYTSRTGEEERLWYQPFVVIGSLAVFMIYFFILREENDIDEKLSVSLYDHFDEFEQQKLQKSLNHKKEPSIDTEDVKKQVKHLDKEK